MDRTARTTLSPADVAAHVAASHVRSVPSPKSVASKADARTGLTASGRGALRRLETELAWAER
jgi:hypothetical protein